ncbi:hypothetical protein NDU88_006036 [Pleurodeles waltl]|uniref:Uncharacterized protein n=1 Tax=Pleurodeles waltl TaxID=8319 RepID=A0AAV7RR03_PLEWA|nr:hypothetical protein NDU88_006036 [Pleurodeles waltl]
MSQDDNNPEVIPNPDIRVETASEQGDKGPLGRERGDAQLQGAGGEERREAGERRRRFRDAATERPEYGDADQTRRDTWPDPPRPWRVQGKIVPPC